MFKTLTPIIELPKLNNSIFVKNKQVLPPIRYIKKNNILLKITFGEKPFSNKFNKKKLK